MQRIIEKKEGPLGLKWYFCEEKTFDNIVKWFISTLIWRKINETPITFCFVEELGRFKMRESGLQSWLH